MDQEYMTSVMPNVHNDCNIVQSESNCYCYEKEGFGDWKSWVSIFFKSLLAYGCWALFVNILKCENMFKCVICRCSKKIKENTVPLPPRVLQNGTNLNEMELLTLENRDSPQPLVSPQEMQSSDSNGTTLTHLILILITFLFWMFVVPVIGYIIDEAARIYKRWPLYYSLTSIISLIVSIFTEWFINKTNKLDVLALVGLLSIGFVQIYSNLHNTSKPMDTSTHAKRLISTEYTIFLWLCCFLSGFTFKFVTKILKDSEENTEDIQQVNNEISKKQQCRNLFSSIKKTTMKFAKSLCRRHYDSSYRAKLFSDEKVNMCIRMFSFVWSANLLREFLNLLVDYEKYDISYFWHDLSWSENKMILFNGVVVIMSFINSSLCQIEYYVVDRIHLTLGFVTFTQIIYYFRVTLIYQQQRWLIADITEIINGHLFIVVGIWFLFYLNIKRNNSS